MPCDRILQEAAKRGAPHEQAAIWRARIRIGCYGAFRLAPDREHAGIERVRPVHAWLPVEAMIRLIAGIGEATADALARFHDRDRQRSRTTPYQLDGGRGAAEAPANDDDAMYPGFRHTARPAG